jgi:hypothetical protein
MDMTAAYAAFARRHQELPVEATELRDGDRLMDNRERDYNQGDCFGRVVFDVKQEEDRVTFKHALGNLANHRDVRNGFIRNGNTVTVLREKARTAG